MLLIKDRVCTLSQFACLTVSVPLKYYVLAPRESTRTPQGRSIKYFIHDLFLGKIFLEYYSEMSV